MLGIAEPTIGSKFIRRGEIWTCVAIDTAAVICDVHLEMDEEEVADVIAEFGISTKMFALKSEKGYRVGVTMKKIDSDMIWFK